MKNIILSGDFNTELPEVKSFIETDLSLIPHLDGKARYNTENRVQHRNRDGQVGLDVIQRCVDGIFYQPESSFKLLAALKADDNNFAYSINQEGLTRIK
jgi:hypothetical protein